MFRNLILSTLLLVPPLAAATSVSPAQLLASYWLDGSAGLDISGLSFCHGELLAVSDKNSAEIYSVETSSRGAVLKSRSRIAGLGVPEGDSAGLVAGLLNLARSDTAMDFEGISCDGDSIYLISERHSRIAEVAAGETTWMPQRWASVVRASGYLKKFNAGAEGLVKAGRDFWIAMEREPRGLLHLRSSAEPRIFTIPPVAGLDFRNRAEDITGLAFYDGALFTLERNAFAVCRRSLNNLQAQWCIDYRNIEEAPEFVYEETQYGKGEGLAVDASGIYVVLDNNNVGRAAVPADRRALLLHLEFPPGMRSSSSASGPKARSMEQPQR
ncbi:SdiA-regulated domain-containing protein [Microbulbifer taiwanensis]|uniref:SdiA-regulated domain-containing protein n=1 Tax=Microbulbifer taiwanensis TaxID=986746 RepID=A0ABW1YKN1_9GAMM|nr:SdiA-regulated domain-containing protein [Microbulbifer taiwanensis]